MEFGEEEEGWSEVEEEEGWEDKDPVIQALYDDTKKVLRLAITS